jgi:hypothetical protein
VRQLPASSNHWPRSGPSHLGTSLPEPCGVVNGAPATSSAIVCAQEFDLQSAPRRPAAKKALPVYLQQPTCRADGQHRRSVPIADIWRTSPDHRGRTPRNHRAWMTGHARSRSRVATLSIRSVDERPRSRDQFSRHIGQLRQRPQSSFDRQATRGRRHDVVIIQRAAVHSTAAQTRCAAEVIHVICIKPASRA